MQNTTEQYKASMKKLIRNRSTALVMIGEVDADLQFNAKGNEGYAGYAAYYARKYFYENGIMFRNGTSEVYSTLENDFTRADGSMLFAPRSAQEELIHDTGYTSNSIMGTSTYEQTQIALTDTDGETIATPLTVTVEFVEYPPVDVLFQIWNGASVIEKSIQGNEDYVVSVTFETIPAATGKYILVIGGKSDGAIDRRLRIKRVTFGDGIMILPEIIEETETNYHCSRINEDLPTADATIELINYGSRYDADNPENPLAILDNDKQTIDIHYGYDVADDNNYEWVHGGKFVVDNWESSQHRAKIVGKDILQNNDDKYIHDNNEMLADGIHSTCAEWILDICGYGVSTFADKIPVIFDADLWRIYITIPVPSLSRKECLQLIANYACKTMYIDRDGVINISAHSDSTRQMDLLATDTVVSPAVVPSEYTGTITSNYRYVYVTITRLDTNFKYNVPLEIIGDSYFFYPEDWDLVTDVKIDIYGENVLDEPPIEVEKDDVIEDMTVNKEELIKDVIVPYYREIYQPIEEQPIGSNLFDIDNLEQGTISSGGVPQPSNTRLRSIDYVVLEAGTYTLSASGCQVSMLVYSMTESYISGESYSNWYNSPKTMTLNAKRKVKFVFKKTSEAVIVPTDLNNVMLEYGDTATSYEPYRSSREIWADENAYGDASGKYRLDVDLGSMYTNVIICVDGREFAEQVYADYVSAVVDVPNDFEPHLVAILADCQTLYTSQSVVVPVNTTGKPLEWKNPLVATQERAEAIGEYIADYVASNIFYEYEYRGNPEYDVNDTIKQSNDFVDDMQTIITDHKIGFNGALHGNMTTRRRIDNGMDNT